MSTTTVTDLSSDQPATLIESEELLCNEIDTMRPLLEADIHQARSCAESAFLRLTYIGLHLSQLRTSLKNRKRTGDPIGFVELLEARWNLSYATASRWMKIAKVFGEFLLVSESDEGMKELEWKEDLPAKYHALSQGEALRLLKAPIDPGDGETEKSPRQEMNLLEFTMRYRGTLTKDLERKPIDQRDDDDCYQLLQSINPVVEIATKLRERLDTSPTYSSLI